jgi:hypothetical protein
MGNYEMCILCVYQMHIISSWAEKNVSAREQKIAAADMLFIIVSIIFIPENGVCLCITIICISGRCRARCAQKRPELISSSSQVNCAWRGRRS